MIHRRKIKVAEPGNFYSWLRAAATAYSKENGQPIGDNPRPCVNADHMLHALTTETVRLLLIVKEHSPGDFRGEVEKVLHAIVTATGGRMVKAEDDAEIDRRTLQ